MIRKGSDIVIASRRPDEFKAFPLSQPFRGKNHHPE
jgi:hypothetical protein